MWDPVSLFSVEPHTCWYGWCINFMGSVRLFQFIFLAFMKLGARRTPMLFLDRFPALLSKPGSPVLTQSQRIKVRLPTGTDKCYAQERSHVVLLTQRVNRSWSSLNRGNLQVWSSPISRWDIRLLWKAHVTEGTIRFQWENSHNQAERSFQEPFLFVSGH